MKNHHDHIEELIDRFVSNTATAEETDELFDIIAAEPERGKDLAAAARLQTEFDRDLALIDVPADTYEAIIAAAPFSTAAATTTVAGSVTGAGTATGLFGWVSLNSIMLSVTSGVLALATLIFMAVTVLDQQPTQPAQSLPGTSASRQTTRQTSSQATRQATRQASFPASLLPGTENPENPLTVEPPGPEQPLITYAQPYSRTYTESYAQPPTESYAQPYTESYAQPNTESFIKSVTLRVQQRPITSTSIDQQQGAVANLGLELSTPINDQLAVGLGMYNDNFPLRVVNTTGDTVLSSNMTWGGAHARWTPQLQLPLDVQLFAQLTIGGSSRGMITQPALGLARSFGPLNLGVGIDCSAFAFQNNGAWNMTLQPGLRATLGIKF